MIDPIEKLVLFLAFTVLIRYQCEKQLVSSDVNLGKSSRGMNLIYQINSRKRTFGHLTA
jgi:hypothetical protein